MKEINFWKRKKSLNRFVLAILRLTLLIKRKYFVIIFYFTCSKKLQLRCYQKCSKEVSSTRIIYKEKNMINWFIIIIFYILYCTYASSIRSVRYSALFSTTLIFIVISNQTQSHRFCLGRNAFRLQSSTKILTYHSNLRYINRVARVLWQNLKHVWNKFNIDIVISYAWNICEFMSQCKIHVSFI